MKTIGAIITAKKTFQLTWLVHLEFKSYAAFPTFTKKVFQGYKKLIQNLQYKH
jgi:hypothetical protein